MPPAGRPARVGRESLPPDELRPNAKKHHRSAASLRQLHAAWVAIAAREVAGPPPYDAVARVELELTGVFSWWPQAWDPDALVSACKGAIDALVRLVLLVDDSGRHIVWLTAGVTVERGTAGYVLVTLTEAL